jgi:hypothetical protein
VCSDPRRVLAAAILAPDRHAEGKKILIKLAKNLE